MANSLYEKARQAFLNGDISWANDTIKIALVKVDPTGNQGYKADLSAHQFLNSISTQHVLATSLQLLDKTSTNGVADASDVTFSVANGNAVTGSVGAVVIYQEGVDRGTSRLIAYLDQINGLPIQNANNTSLTIHWDNGQNKIFKL